MEEGVPFKSFLYIEEDPKPEVRRFSLNKIGTGRFRQLMGKLREVYPKLKAHSFTMAWKDEDDDEILMSSDEEVTTMYHQSNDTVLKIYVRITGPKKDALQEFLDEKHAGDTIPSKSEIPGCVHEGITCKCCGRPVVGFRYKCVSCDEYDLCAQCEYEGKHPAHCVVRVPLSNMPLPLIKATIKKSRKFLKSVASQAHEDSKKVRRERCKQNIEILSNIQGKDSQPGTSRNWIQIFGKYLEEFTNLAGDINSNAEKKPESETEKLRTELKASTSEQISLNPWNLPQTDLDKLQYACKFVQKNAQPGSSKPMKFDKVLEMAATSAEEATAQASARASSPIREGTQMTSPQSQPKTPSAGQQTQADLERVNAAKEAHVKRLASRFVNDAPKAVQDAIKAVLYSMKITQEMAKNAQKISQEARKATLKKIAQDTPKVAQEALIEALTSGQLSLADSETPPEKQKIKPTAFVKGILESSEPKDEAEQLRCDVSDLLDIAQAELSSNGSLCSSDGQGSDKAEGWTVIDQPERYNVTLKDVLMKLDLLDAEKAKLEDTKREDFNSIYPDLETVADDLQEDDVADPATAPTDAPADDTTDDSADETTDAPAADDTTDDAVASAPQAKTDAKAKNEALKTIKAKKIKGAAVLASPKDRRTTLSPHVEAAVRQMEAMGFSNESGWLSQLLDHNDGNIATVLDLITPAIPPK